MLRTFVAAMFAVIAVACTAPSPGTDAAAVTDTPASSAPFVGIDGKPLVSAEGIVDNSVQEALTADPAACAKAGGALQPVCRMQQPMCIIAFDDAGKSCTDGAQCGSGRCMAKDGVTSGSPATGQCAANNDPCGCYTLLGGGVALATICAD